MRTSLLLLFLPLLISSYNLDVSHLNYAVGYLSTKYFGYSVGLYSENNNSSTGFKSWLFVGEPNRKMDGGNESGVLYCAPQPRTHGEELQMSGSMTKIVNDTFETSLKRVWLGAAMDVSEKDGSVTACAPGTTLTVWSDGKIEDETLQGVCFSGSVHSWSLEVQDFSTYKRNNNPITGFAVHYPRSKTSLEFVSPIIGSPMHENVGAVHKLANRNWTTLENYSGHYLSLFGYAISSGNYFNKEQLMVAGGAPGWNHVGQVAIMEYQHDNSTPFSITSKINGTEFGEFFGASLTTGDLNNDGLDDLIVGAPHWRNDNGRVYIYLGNKEGFSKAVIVLEGSVDDGLYGYTLSSGDLDNDGFDDLIVAAPWEGSGVIYVYNGDFKLGAHGSIKPSQKITVSNMEGFGFSLSKPVDVDNNGFPDVAVGAYGSSRAGIIRSKPVVKTIILLSTVPAILSRNSTSFVVKFCIDIDLGRYFDGVMILSVDKNYKRVNETVTKYKISETSEFPYCNEKTIFLHNRRNYIDDIEIFAEYQFNISDSECTNMGRWLDLMCPLKYKDRNPSNRTMLPFDIDCGVDRICQASIVAKMEFQGISNAIYTIGSNDFNLFLKIENNGEPAYSTSVIFSIPEGIFVNRLLPSCHEERDEKPIIVKCDVGDPLTKNMQKNISLNLDMGNFFNGSLNDTTLFFTADIKTRSVNQGQSRFVIPLKLETNVSIALSGNSYSINRTFAFNNKPSKVDFHHNYEISKFGITPISKVLLKLLVPYKVGCYKFFTIAEKPRVFLSDRFYQCTVSDRLVSKQKISADKSLIKATIANQLKRLRMSLKHNRTTRIMKANKKQLQCENIRSQLATQKSNVMYLNCSTSNVMCEEIECEISFLNIAYGIGRLPVQLNIGISEIIGHTGEQDIAIHFTTEASVHVLNPITQFGIPGSGNSFSLTTIFNFSPNPTYDHSIFNTIMKDVKVLKEEVGIMTILGSILLGLLLVGLVAIFLRYMGFFERKKIKEPKREEMEMHILSSNDDQGFQ